jgi:lysophospholipase L1-like esterase
VPPDEFAANLERFARYARDAGASVVFLTTPYRLAKAGDPDESEREYRLSADLAARGECGRSRDAFERARASEPARIARDLGEYNAIMRRAAARLRAPLVDAEGLLGQEGGMFVDLIHPSGEGHNRIARSLADTILSARLLGG